MDIIPALDLRGGNCVRLYQGDLQQEDVYSQNPVEVARGWEKRGASRLHIVDLDGAFGGHPRNLKLIERIREEVSISLQIGGGIRNKEQAEEYLRLGMEGVILGTAALKKPELIAGLCQQYGERILVGLDSRNNRLAVEGWVKEVKLTPLQLAKEMKEIGVRRIIATDINRDGTLEGPNYRMLEELVATGLKVTASGGISSAEELGRLNEIESLEGVIIGRALYTGDLVLEELLQLQEEGEL